MKVTTSIFILLFFSMFVSCKNESKEKHIEKKTIEVDKITMILPSDVNNEIVKSITELKKYDLKGENSYGLNFVNSNVDSSEDLQICLWLLDSKKKNGFTYIFKNTNRFAKISENLSLPIIFGTERYFELSIPESSTKKSNERCLRCIYFSQINGSLQSYTIKKTEICGNGI